MKRAMEEAVRKIIGCKGGKIAIMREAMERKVEARIKWIRMKQQQHREKYKKMRKECNKIFQSSKEEWIKGEMEEIEKEKTERTQEIFTKKLNNKQEYINQR
ncbi:hypothetical protein ILUMI_13492 [Ignelater luminosus]|uniref:Uncharacterized protein n=1 Tax=Ignelater luminosus TaxID=2038154 RepID=A0A8K0GBE3_IGNLU|nr:hypothetical protein ILUMI_13492 [Ignelater luminosus]